MIKTILREYVPAYGVSCVPLKFSKISQNLQETIAQRLNNEDDCQHTCMCQKTFVLFNPLTLLEGELRYKPMSCLSPYMLLNFILNGIIAIYGSVNKVHID